MTTTLKLTKRQKVFLKENRQDPITGDAFSLGDEIVFCAECKSAFLKDSWEYMSSEHCNQKRTLKTFPSISTLKLKKRILNNFEKASLGNRFGAFIFDVIIGVALAVLVLIINDSKSESYIESWLVFIIYIIFRDIFLLKGSIGKKIFGLYFTPFKQKDKIIYLQILFRNLIFWIPALIFYLLMDKEERTNTFLTSIFFTSFIVLALFNFLFYPTYFFFEKKSLIDHIFKITLVQKKEM
jgi:uncharacterized RDD family membrane protein YckC